MYLRKIFFVCLFLFALKSASAQTSKFQVGVKGGLNLSAAFFNDAESVKLKPGYHFGATFGYLITPKFELQSGVYVSNTGSKLEGYSICGNACRGTTLTTFDEQYFKLPLYAAYRKIFSDNSTFKIGIGPYFGYGFGGKTKQTDAGSTIREWDTFGKDIESLNKCDFGAGIIADFEYNKIIFGIGFESGILNLMYKQGYPNPFEYRNVNISISAGYRF